MIPPNSAIVSAFFRLGVLVLSLSLVSCSAKDLSKLRLPPSASQLEKEQAQKPTIREVTIPLEKEPPSKMPEALTEIQPALDLKKQEPQGVRFTMSARGVDIKNVLFVTEIVYLHLSMRMELIGTIIWQKEQLDQ